MKTCSNCGTMNFDTNETCEKCRQPLRPISIIRPSTEHLYEEPRPSTERLHEMPYPQYEDQRPTQTNGTNGFRTAIKVFLILDVAKRALMLLAYGILWITCLVLADSVTGVGEAAIVFAVLTITSIALLTICSFMVIVYFNKVSSRRARIGVGFKICVMLFASFIGGILMLCDDTK